MSMIHRLPKSLVLLLLLFWMVGCTSATLCAADANRQPLNVVFVLCDDHRFDCLGAEGHPFLQTPHLYVPVLSVASKK